MFPVPVLFGITVFEKFLTVLTNLQKFPLEPAPKPKFQVTFLTWEFQRMVMSTALTVSGFCVVPLVVPWFFFLLTSLMWNTTVLLQMKYFVKTVPKDEFKPIIGSRSGKSGLWIRIHFYGSTSGSRLGVG